MDFHQTSGERFAEKIYNSISEKVDGKIMNSPEFNVALMIKYLPFDINDEDIIDTNIEISNNNNESEDTPVEDINNNIDDNASGDEELFSDNITDTPVLDKKEKKKKKKKEKKEGNKELTVGEISVKKSRKPNKCIYFRTHPDNQQLIEENAQEDNPDKPGKKIGKVKSGCALWNSLSTDEQEEWGVRCMEDNTD